MKKLGLVLGLGLLSASSLFADYQLTLIDKDGTETKQCIKSYSFSNNLESLARKNTVGLKDVYSEEETMTNKIWIDGKPIYRRVQILTGFNEDDNNWKVINYNFDTSVIEKLVSGEVDFNDRHERYTFKQSSDSQFRYEVRKDGLRYASYNGYISSSTIATIIIEYTKTTDEANSSSNTFKSYLHYVPSSSTDEEVITKDIKNLGVQFLEGYTYDSSTDSCTKE